MELGTENREGICVITGNGDLDSAGAAALKKLFMQRVLQQNDRFVVVMNGIGSIDSDGVGALLFIASTARRLMLRYCFAAPSGTVLTVLEKIRIAGYFFFAESLEAALEQLADGEPEELVEL
jgi:anti-sigma B factor antagonist